MTMIGKGKAGLSYSTSNDRSSGHNCALEAPQKLAENAGRAAGRFRAEVWHSEVPL